MFAQIRASRCRAHDADLRVRVLGTGRATYSDVTVVRGPWYATRATRTAVTNPTLIVEVLSPSTEAYDRGDKFEHYKRMPALRQYVLVAHGEPQIEVWTRSPSSEWTRVIAQASGRVALESIGAELAVDDVHAAAAEPR